MDIGSEVSGLANLIAPVLKPPATGLEFFGIGVILSGAAMATAGIARCSKPEQKRARIELARREPGT